MQEIPSAFAERIRKDFPDDGEQLLQALLGEPKTSVHVKREYYSEILEGATEVPWFPRGRILKQRPVFTLDPLFHAGQYYPQESSSMFLFYILDEILKGKDDLRVLDLCAAPGGKSILISEYLGNNGVLISNEINKGRNQVLKENLIKWAADNVLITSSDAKKFGNLTGYFDCVIVDAPCSGEGMFRKDKDARDEWSEQNVRLCALRQEEILENISPAIREGGYLIYSTCTFAKDENEFQCRRLIESDEWESVEIGVVDQWGIHKVNGEGFIAHQFLPHRIPGEGFFVAVFKKKESTSTRLGRGARIFNPITSNQKKVLGDWIIDDENYHQAPDGLIYRSPLSLEELNGLASEVYFTLPGSPVGKIIHDELIPEHALALSRFLSHEVLRIELDEKDSLSFLRGDNVSSDTEPGWSVITHKTHPLGWVKVMKNRINNYFPKEYRIRMR